MISNEDYKDLKDSATNGLSLLYNYYVASFGKRLSPGGFYVKFQQWTQQHKGTEVNTAIKQIIEYLDGKHEYQGII